MKRDNLFITVIFAFILFRIDFVQRVIVALIG